MTGSHNRSFARFACTWLFMLLAGLLQSSALAQRVDATFFSTITVNQRTIHFEMTLPASAVPAIGEESSRSRHPTEAFAALIDAAGRKVQVFANGKLCPSTGISPESGGPGSVEDRLVLDFVCTELPETLGVRYDLYDELGAEHRTLALIVWPGGSQQFTFQPGASELHLDIKSAAIRSVAGTSIGLGVQQFALGWGYLVFLACILMPAGERRQFLLVALSYMAASSLALALAGAMAFRIPGEAMAGAIAISVAYVGAVNLFSEREVWQRRCLVGSIVGAIHGVGLAQPLLLTAMAHDDAMRILVEYLFGVQFGIVGFIAFTTPVILWVRRNRWGSRAESAMSSIAMAIGAAAFLNALVA